MWYSPPTPTYGLQASPDPNQDPLGGSFPKELHLLEEEIALRLPRLTDPLSVIGPGCPGPCVLPGNSSRAGLP
jgi:hypothetical protein